MIQIHEISEAPEFKDKFIACGLTFKTSTIPRYYADEAALLDPEKNFFFHHGGQLKAFVALSDGEPVGRIGAMINPIIRTDHKKLGLVGLFESVPKFDVTRQLLDKAITWLRSEGCEVIQGPMDFSIWQTYRFQVDHFQSKPFLGEPRNPGFYPRFFERYGFRKAIGWESHLLDPDDLQVVVNNFEKHGKMFDQLGYSLVRFSQKPAKVMMSVAYDLMLNAYQRFWSFSPISRCEFLNMYSQMPRIFDKNHTVFLRDPQGKYIGFILSLRDLSDANPARRAVNWLSRLNGKRTGKIVNIYQVGALPSAIQEALSTGMERFEEYFSVFQGGAHHVMKSILAGGDYDFTAFALMSEKGVTHRYAQKVNNQNRHYNMYQFS